MFTELLEYLDTTGLAYQKLPDRSTVRFGIGLEHGHYDCYADALEDTSQFIVCSVSPVKIPVNKRQLVAEFVARINYRLLFGSLEMDFSDGEIRYKTTLIYDEGIPPTDALIDRTIRTNLRMMDRFFPGIMAIVYGNAMPEDMAHQALEEPNPGRN